jgi:hypothetical protein
LLTFWSCSPKDQAVLEAEYTQNPKPNKAARAVIVEKVDMNEKEVQVSNLNELGSTRGWIQTRRTQFGGTNMIFADMVPESSANKSKKITATPTSRDCGIWIRRHGSTFIGPAA